MGSERTVDGVSWGYPLVKGVSQDKSGTRPSVEGPLRAWELVGVDGGSKGGLRAMPPFGRIRSLHPDDVEWPEDDNEGENPYEDEIAATEVVDFRPVTLGVGSRWRAYGFIYRAKRPSGETYDLFFEWWDSITDGWSTELLDVDVAGDVPFDAAVQGRFVHVVIQGEDPLVVRIDLDDPDTPTTATLSVVRPSGPGKKPLISLAGVVSGADAWFFDDEAQTEQQLPEGRPALARVAIVNNAVTTSYSESAAYGTGDAHEGEIAELQPGDYAIVIQFEDSRSERRGQPSDPVEIRKSDFTSDTTTRPIVIEGVYDSDKFDRMLVWRSTRTQDAGGVFTAGILILESIVVLSEYGRDSDPYNETGVGHFLYAFRLRDKELVTRADRTLVDPLVYLETVPPGGTAVMHDSTLVVSGIRGMPDPSEDVVVEGDLLRNVGEVRWSSVMDPLPENFPPGNRWMPPRMSDEVIRFAAAGDSLIGFSKSRVYVLRKDNGFMRAYATHVGYGIALARAACALGGGVYYATTDGVKAIYANAQLDDVDALDGLFADSGWADDSLSMAFDARLAAIVVLNAARGKAALLWAAGGVVTESHWLPFKAVESGQWPPIDEEGEFDDDGELEDRALFLYSQPDAGTSEELEEPLPSRPAIFAIMDNCPRGWTIRDCIDSVAVIDTVEEEGETRRVTLEAGPTLDPSCLVGCILSIVGSTNTSRIGTTYRVLATDGLTDATTLLLELYGETEEWGIAEGDEVVIGGPLFRWVGANIGGIQGEGIHAASALLDVKYATSMRASFAGVGTPVSGGSLEKRIWLASVWHGTEEAPAGRSVAKDGKGRVVQSVKNGVTNDQPALGERHFGGVQSEQGTAISPGIEVVCPGLDFRLIAAALEGRISGTQSTALGST